MLELGFNSTFFNDFIVDIYCPFLAAHILLLTTCHWMLVNKAHATFISFSGASIYYKYYKKINNIIANIIF